LLNLNGTLLLGCQAHSAAQTHQWNDTHVAHTIFEWRKRQDDPAAGVALAFRGKHFNDRNVSRVYIPPTQYQGRVGAVRFRRGDADFCIIVAYILVEPHTQAQKQYNAQLWQWIQHLLDQLPSRGLPILLLDANGRVGMESSQCVGNSEPRRQNYNGSLLHECLQHHHLLSSICSQYMVSVWPYLFWSVW